MNGDLYVIKADTSREFTVEPALMNTADDYSAFAQRLGKVRCREVRLILGHFLLGGDSRAATSATE